MQNQLIEPPKSDEVREYKMLVGGEWIDARSGKTFESTNPYTGRVWATAPEAGDEDVDAAVSAAREAFDEGPWGALTGTERARLLRRLAELIAENAEDIAVVESTDNGKLLRRCRDNSRHYPNGTTTSRGLRIRFRARPSPLTSQTSLSTPGASL